MCLRVKVCFMSWFSPKRKFLMLLAVMLVALSIQTTGLGGGNVASADPQVGEHSYDMYNCEIIYTGTQWEYFTIGNVTYCYRQVGMTSFDAYTRTDLMANNNSFVGLSPVFLREFADVNGSLPSNVMLYKIYTGDKLWRRLTINPRLDEVFYDGAWVPERNYQADLAAANQAKTEAERAAAEAEAEASSLQAQAMIAQANANAVGIWVAPDCESSYNGCSGS